MAAKMTARSALLPSKRRQLAEQQAAEERRLRQQLLVRSALAAALAALTESLAERGDSRSPECVQAVEDIETIRKWIDELPATETALDPAGYTEAKGIVYNARARAAHHQEHYKEALEFYEKAISSTHLVDSYIGIAAVLFKTSPPYGPKNQARIEAELQKALRISPTSGKAHHYLGKLATDRGDFQKALEAFNKAEEHPWTLFLHAEVLAERLPAEERRPLEALELLERSIELRARPDERYDAFCRYLINWLPTCRNSAIPAVAATRPRLHARAIDLAKELEAAGVRPELKERGRQLLNELQSTQL
jgi:tetratricopeptide (TPR) repeat protein